MIAYSASGRVQEDGTTIITGKPEELDWLGEQIGNIKGYKRNTKSSATAPLTTMKELAQKFPKRIVAVP
ncbi:MAG: hypothetical protein AB1603_03375 [Chloroflexota bacterium]